MKKLGVVAIAILFGISNLNAQDEVLESSTQIKFGAKAGINFASGINEDVSGLKGRTSFHVGGVANIGISDEFSVQPELLYSAQGAKWENFTIMVDYINIPVMASYKVAEGLSIQAGPQFGFNISSKYKEDTGNNIDTNPSTETTTSLGRASSNSSKLNKSSQSNTEKIENTTAVDFGFGAGAQYVLENNLFFQVRYVLGFNDVIDNIKGKNKVFSLSVGKFF